MQCHESLKLVVPGSGEKHACIRECTVLCLPVELVAGLAILRRMSETTKAGYLVDKLADLRVVRKWASVCRWLGVCVFGQLQRASRPQGDAESALQAECWTD